MTPTAGGRRFAGAAACAGVLAAVALPGNRPGLGVALVALAVAAAAAVGLTAFTARPFATAWRRARFRLGVATLALALTATAVLRAADWLMTVELIGALALASLAAAGGRTWAGVAEGAAAVVRRAPVAPFFVARCADGPYASAARRMLPAARGLALGIALVVVFGSLFASADRAFAALAGDVLTPDLGLDFLPARLLFFLGVAALPGALVLAAIGGANGQAEGRASEPSRRSRAEWLVALLLLDLLFALFVAVQVRVLFGGHAHVLATEGLTYAEYAREGFFQLLVVAFLTLAVIAFAVRYSGNPAARRPAAIEVLLGVLCLLTFVVLASALRRLNLYEDAFGFTVARLTGHAVTLWVGALLGLVVAAGLARRGGWLPRGVALLTGAALLAFGLADPEGRVAERNVTRFERIGKIDLAYLQTLGPDAAPALAQLPRAKASCALRFVLWDLEEPDGLFELNAGRAAARRATEDLSTTAVERTCL